MNIGKYRSGLYIVFRMESFQKITGSRWQGRFLAVTLMLAFLVVVITSGRARQLPMGTEMAALSLVCVAFALFLFSRNALLRLTPWSCVGFVVGAYFIGRACMSPVAYYGFQDTILVLWGIGMYFLGAWTSNNKGASRWIMSALWILCLLNYVSVFIQNFVDKQFLLGYPHALLGGVGLFTYYNMYGHFMGTIGIFALFRGIWGEGGKARVGWIALGIMGLCGVLMCLSRGSLVALFPAFLMGAAGSVIIFYRSLLNRIIWGIVGLVLGVVAVLGGLTVAVLHLGDVRFGEFTWQSFFLIGVRGDLVNLGRELSSLGGLWGWGARSFEYEVYHVWGLIGPSIANSTNLIHNEYSQVHVEYGFVGLSLMLFLLGVSLVRGVYLLCSLPKKTSYIPYSDEVAVFRGNVIGGLSVIAYASFHAYGEFVWHILPLVCVMGYVLGIMAGRMPVWNMKYKPKFLGKSARIVLGVLFLVMGVWSAQVSVNALPVWYWEWKDLQLSEEVANSPKQVLAQYQAHTEYRRKIYEKNPAVVNARDYVLAWMESDKQEQGRQYNSWEMLSAALPIVEKAHQQFPQEPKVHLLLATIYSERQNFGMAEREFQELLAWVGDAELQQNVYLAHVYFLLKRAWVEERTNNPEKAYAYVLWAIADLERSHKIMKWWSKDRGKLYKELKLVKEGFEKKGITPDSTIASPQDF